MSLACMFARIPPEIILQIFKSLDTFDSVAAFRLSHWHCQCAITSTHDTNITVIIKHIAAASLPGWNYLKALYLVHILPISDFTPSTLSTTVVDFAPSNVLLEIQRLRDFGASCVFRFINYHQSLDYIPASHDPTAHEIERISRGVYICSLIYNIGRKRRERADQLPAIKSRRRYFRQPATSQADSDAVPVATPGAVFDELGILHDWGYSRDDCILTTHLDHITTRDLLYALHVATFFRRAYEALYGVPDRFLFENIPDNFLQHAPNDIVPVSDPKHALIMPFEGVSPDYQWPCDWTTSHLELVSYAVLKRQQVDPAGQDREERRVREGPLIACPPELMRGGDSRMTIGWGCWDFQQEAIRIALEENFEILGPVETESEIAMAL